ncbi:MAG TPA: hypothetical protein PKE39_04380 [Ignavibacteria bacterium]|nr:hypothetical protein [Ignavibacteria bacterium]HMQ98239.1 hypothetical protein [Ignavibacteria bacterium]
MPKINEQSKYDACRFIDATLKAEISEQIELFFNALMYGREYKIEHGSFDQYDYCKYKAKQFCGKGEKMPVALHINEFRFLGKSVTDCKLVALRAFLGDRPFYPTFIYKGELVP